VDDCGICGGFNQDQDDCAVCFGMDADKDCAGVCFGTSITDVCGLCLLPSDPAFDKSCLGCDGVPSSGLQFDSCCVCGGSGPVGGRCLIDFNTTHLLQSSVGPTATGTAVLTTTLNSAAVPATSLVEEVYFTRFSGSTFDVGGIDVTRIDFSLRGPTLPISVFMQTAGPLANQAAPWDFLARDDSLNTQSLTAIYPNDNLNYVPNRNLLTSAVGNSVAGDWRVRYEGVGFVFPQFSTYRYDLFITYSPAFLCGSFTGVPGAAQHCVDCAGVTDGPALFDDCCACDGANADKDSCGVCFGFDLDKDDCGVCFGNNTNKDCAGVCFGPSLPDDCGVCDGTNQDKDLCDVCFGDNSTCEGLSRLVDSRTCGFGVFVAKNRD
jgi:hypothetical protein